MPTLIDRHIKIPQYLQLAEHLRQEIASGNLQPDDRLPSLNELKEQFGANQRTAEKAHALLEEDGLIRREPGRGVFVNHPMQRRRTGNVGFVTRYNAQLNHDVAYWGYVLAGMRQAACDRDYQLLLIDNGSDFERWEKIDGAAFYMDGFGAAYSSMPDIPCVSILNEIPGSVYVTSDDLDGTYQLTRHLIQSGHRRIAFLAVAGAGFSLLEKRKEGYLKALSEAGIEPEPHWVRELRHRREWNGLASEFMVAGEHYTNRWLEENWTGLGCTALVAQNDDTARGAIRAFEAAGLQVPRDVSVVGFDGLPAPGSTPQLTTIQVPLQEMGKRAMLLLLDWLNDPAQTPQNICLPVSFVQGQTTAPPLAISEHALVTA